MSKTIRYKADDFQVVSETKNYVRLRRLHKRGVPAIRQALGFACDADLASAIKCHRSHLSEYGKGRRKSLPPEVAARLVDLLREKGEHRLAAEVAK